MSRLLSVHRVHYRHGGAEAVHLDHLALFREQGWDCAEFAMAHPRNEPSDWARYFPSYFDPEHAKGLGRAAAAARFVWSREARRNFAALLDDFRPDAIHVHGTYYQLTPSIFGIARQRGIPVVFTLHDYKLLCPAHHLFRPGHGACEDCKGGHQYRCFTNRCVHGSYAASAVYGLEGFLQWHSRSVRDSVSLFVGPSRFIVDKFIEHGYPAERLRYVPNFFETTAEVPVPADQIAALRERYGRYLLYFGRLSPEKGLPILVEAAHRAGVRLVLAGHGPDAEALRRQVADLGADVIFTGHLTGADLWAHVEAAHAVTLPSICYENAPKALLEAQSRSKLVITTATGGMPEMVEHGQTGFVVPKNDPAALAATLRHAMALSEEEARALGQAARRYVLGTFTRERYYREMTGVYQELLRAPLASQKLAFT